MSDGYKSSEFLPVLIAMVVWAMQSLGIDANLLIDLIGQAKTSADHLDTVARYGHDTLDLPGIILAAIYYAGQKYYKQRDRNNEPDGGQHDHPRTEI